MQHHSVGHPTEPPPAPLGDTILRRGFQIIVDTREQRPYHFASTPTLRKALKVGDYTAVGLEGEAAVERKSLKDFAGTVLTSAERFERELLVLGGYRHSMIVIEGSPARILAGECRADIGAANPRSIVGLATYCHVKYGVPVLWAGDRQTACEMVEAFLWIARKNKQREAEQAARAAWEASPFNLNKEKTS